MPEGLNLGGERSMGENDCPGHVGRDDDPKVCRHCGTHVDSLRPVTSAWKVGPVVTKHPGGASYTLPGWVRGQFGLDYRFDEAEGGAWVLTHLLSGYAAFAIQEPLETAQAIAEEVAAWGDWDFADPTEAARFKGRLPQLREHYPETITHVSKFPLRTFMVSTASAIEARSGETGTGSTEGESAARKGTPKDPQESNQ